MTHLFLASVVVRFDEEEEMRGDDVGVRMQMRKWGSKESRDQSAVTSATNLAGSCTLEIRSHLALHSSKST